MGIRKCQEFNAECAVKQHPVKIFDVDGDGIDNGHAHSHAIYNDCDDDDIVFFFNMFCYFFSADRNCHLQSTCPDCYAGFVHFAAVRILLANVFEHQTVGLVETILFQPTLA